MFNNKRIILSKDFRRNLAKRFGIGSKLEKTINERIEMFLHDRTNPILRDHHLLGRLAQYKSFSITGDIRIIYMEEEDRYIFMDIGTHNQLYG